MSTALPLSISLNLSQAIFLSYLLSPALLWNSLSLSTSVRPSFFPTCSYYQHCSGTLFLSLPQSGHPFLLLNSLPQSGHLSFLPAVTSLCSGTLYLSQAIFLFSLLLLGSALDSLPQSGHLSFLPAVTRLCSETLYLSQAIFLFSLLLLGSVLELSTSVRPSFFSPCCY